MKQLFLLALVLLSNLAVAQTNKLLIGKWVFADVADKQKLDAESQQMVTKIFGDLTLNFRTDNTMTMVMMKKTENGHWELDPADDKKIVATSDKGSIANLVITTLDAKQLVIKIGTAGPFIMNKASETPDAMVKKDPAPKIMVTARQITAKWDVVDMEREKKSEIFYDLLKGAYIQFNEDGTYHTKILTLEEDGEWMLTKNNTVIEVENEQNKGYWNILKASDTEMTLQRGDDGPKYMFRKSTD